MEQFVDMDRWSASKATKEEVAGEVSPVLAVLRPLVCMYSLYLSINSPFFPLFSEQAFSYGEFLPFGRRNAIIDSATLCSQSENGLSRNPPSSQELKEIKAW